MAAYKFETYDVFTDKMFTGNPLAVVWDADDLSTPQMQMIAREFNLAETVFITAPGDAENSARLRIFTTVYELPFAGHPTVGAAIAIARARDAVAPLRLELNTGLFPVSIETRDGQLFAEFENPNPPCEAGQAPSADALEAALSLPTGALDRNAHRPRCVGAGVEFIYACADIQQVAKARIDSAAFDAMKLKQTVGVLLYAKGGVGEGVGYHARMFAPGAGVPEDPATGSAACALPGQLHLSGALGPGEHQLKVEQGVEMGRPSLIELQAKVGADGVDAVKVGGGAVRMQEGQFFV